MWKGEHFIGEQRYQPEEARCARKLREEAGCAIVAQRATVMAGEASRKEGLVNGLGKVD